MVFIVLNRIDTGSRPHTSTDDPSWSNLGNLSPRQGRGQTGALYMVECRDGVSERVSTARVPTVQAQTGPRTPRVGKLLRSFYAAGLVARLVNVRVPAPHATGRVVRVGVPARATVPPGGRGPLSP